MNEQDLFLAIGQAEDRFLAEADQPKPYRLRKPALIAAVLAILLLTACAAPAVLRSFDKLTGGEPAENGGVIRITTYTSGSKAPSSTEFYPIDVEVEVAVDPDAPNAIEEYWLPLSLLEYCQVESYTMEPEELTLQLSMKVPRYGRAYNILYQQLILPAEGTVTIPGILENGISWTQTVQAYGEVTALEFSGTGKLENEDGSYLLYDGNKVARAFFRVIFWSDGFYLYCLKIPQCYPIAGITGIEEIVTSLTQVEDVTQYLPS